MLLSLFVQSFLFLHWGQMDQENPVHGKKTSLCTCRMKFLSKTVTRQCTLEYLHLHTVPHLLFPQGALSHLCNHEDPRDAKKNPRHMVFNKYKNICFTA